MEVKMTMKKKNVFGGAAVILTVLAA